MWAPWSQNLYVYTSNNPVNFVDPTGHSRELAQFDGGEWAACDILGQVYRCPTDNTEKPNKLTTSEKLQMGLLVAGVLVGPELLAAGAKAVAAGASSLLPKLPEWADEVYQTAENVWNKGIAQRGRIIENLFGKNTPDGFPVLDKWFPNGLSISVKTMNITSQTTVKYMTTKLHEYIDVLANFQGLNYGGLNANVVTQRVLQFVVPTGNLSQSQITALETARYYAAQRGVTMMVQILETVQK